MIGDNHTLFKNMAHTDKELIPVSIQAGQDAAALSKPIC